MRRLFKTWKPELALMLALVTVAVVSPRPAQAECEEGWLATYNSEVNHCILDPGDCYSECVTGG